MTHRPTIRRAPAPKAIPIPDPRRGPWPRTTPHVLLPTLRRRGPLDQVPFDAATGLRPQPHRGLVLHLPRPGRVRRRPRRLHRRRAAPRRRCCRAHARRRRGRGRVYLPAGSAAAFVIGGAADVTPRAPALGGDLEPLPHAGAVMGLKADHCRPTVQAVAAVLLAALSVVGVSSVRGTLGVSADPPRATARSRCAWTRARADVTALAAVAGDPTQVLTVDDAGSRLARASSEPVTRVADLLTPTSTGRRRCSPRRRCGRARRAAAHRDRAWTPRVRPRPHRWQVYTSTGRASYRVASPDGRGRARWRNVSTGISTASRSLQLVARPDLGTTHRAVRRRPPRRGSSRDRWATGSLRAPVSVMLGNVGGPAFGRQQRRHPASDERVDGRAGTHGRPRSAGNSDAVAIAVTRRSSGLRSGACRPAPRRPGSTPRGTGGGGSATAPRRSTRRVRRSSAKAGRTRIRPRGRSAATHPRGVATTIPPGTRSRVVTRRTGSTIGIAGRRPRGIRRPARLVRVSRDAPAPSGPPSSSRVVVARGRGAAVIGLAQVSPGLAPVVAARSLSDGPACWARVASRGQGGAQRRQTGDRRRAELTALERTSHRRDRRAGTRRDPGARGAPRSAADRRGQAGISRGCDGWAPTCHDNATEARMRRAPRRGDPRGHRRPRSIASRW